MPEENIEDAIVSADPEASAMVEGLAGPNVYKEKPKRGGLRNTKIEPRSVEVESKLPDGIVSFRSRSPEPSRFNIDIGDQAFPSHPCNPPGHLEWHIPTSVADRVRRHHLVTSARVVEA